MIRSISTIKYNSRAPGSQVEGTIRYAVSQPVFGRATVGRSQRGIYAVVLAEEAQAWSDQLAAAFPAIEVQADSASLEREMNQVIAFIDKDAYEGVIYLDISGSASKQEVWQAVCGIPSGKTRSDGDVARDLGVPEAAHDVAGACAVNVLAIAISYHRLVRSDGSISGHRWGAERKRALLADEATEALELDA